MAVNAHNSTNDLQLRLERAETRLMEECRRFDDVIEHAPDGLLIVDAGGYILRINRQVEKMFGYSRDELVGQCVDMLVPDAVRPRHANLRAGYVQDPQPRAMADLKDIFGRDKHGVEFPIALSLTPFRFEGETQVLATILDLTSQRYAQEALQESERQLQQAVSDLRDREGHLTNLVRTIPDAVITANAEGMIEEINPAAADMFRTTPDALVGRPVMELFPSEVAKAIDVDRRATGGLEFLKGSVLGVDALRADGEDFRAAVTVNSFQASGGQKLLWILKDVSVELRYEKERQSLHRALEEKNRELESIIYAASHDLRSPLVNLQGFGRELQKSCGAIAALLRNVELDPRARRELDEQLGERIPEALHFIDAGSRKLDQLIRGLLHLSRLGREELRIKAVNMDHLVTEVLRSLEYTIRKTGAQIEVGDLPPCMGDEALLNQVVTNLLDNALKYLDPARKGVIRISGRYRNRDSEYTIEDNGIGIPPTMLNKVFEVFHRLDPSSPVKGEGLGLSIVKRIIDRHNGSVRGEPTDGAGIRFVFSLPAPRPSDFAAQTKKVYHAGT